MALDGKIPPGDPIWSKFNASFVNRELELVDIANEIYTAHPFTTWHANNWRNATNYQLGQHIGIDFDTEDERSTLQHLAKDKFIQRYAALLYTTPSHTPDKPRARAVFLLDTPIHQPKNYTLAVSSLLFLFGSADRQCKDSCRFFYGSRDCQFEWLDNVLPLDTVKQIINQYQAVGNIVKKSHERKDYQPTTDQQEVASALQKIPAMGIDYDEWVKIKWRSFKSDGNGTGQVTLNTVFKMAIDNGWRKAA